MNASPRIISAALFERDGRALVAHRKQALRPFAGQWLLPLTIVRPSETAEDAVKRYARDQFGIEVTRESFVETVYLQDPDDSGQYVANIFRAEQGGGPMRFRADGDYDDARWLAAAEVGQLWMPPALRDPLVRIMTEPEYASEIDWGAGDEPGGAAPLAERGEEARAEEPPPPDNHAAWETIAKMYQEEHARFDPERLRWTRGIYEDELRLLDDIRGQRALVLGCGDGRDAVALTKLGAIVVGVDFAARQLASARTLAAKHGADNASFVEGDITDLSRFDDASFDLALSIHALDFVEHAHRVLAEAERVLRPGGVLALAVLHPWNQIFTNTAPYRAERSYWAPDVDFNWDEERFGGTVRLRAWRRTLHEWIEILDACGFAIERLREPYQGDIAVAEAEGFDIERARLMPQMLIIKARKR